MLEAKNVTFSYSTRGEQDAPLALREVNLSILPGETVAIIGHNGSGKSTLAKLLAAILKPTTGLLQVDELHTDARGEDLWKIRQLVGIVFQNPDDQLVASTVIDDIAFGPENLGLPRFEIEERVQEAMALLELEAYAQVPIADLSIGQKQQVAIAGVLAMRPRYLLLDEPTTMVSSHTADRLLDTVLRLSREQGIAVIHITHFMHEVTGFKRVIVMHEGQIAMADSPLNIFARVDELHAMGLDVPMITHLGQHLRAKGWRELPEVVLSSKQLRTAERGQASTPIPTMLPADSQVVHKRDDGLAGLIELRDVHYTYMRGTPFASEALSGLTLSIPANQTVALVGPTKAGKSTVVDLLGGLMKPGAGTILFEGTDIAASSFDIERIRSTVGIVFQSPEAQIFEETVGKDVSFGPRNKKVPLAESRRLVQESLEAVGLAYEDFRTRYTYALSGGEKRRVAIAGVLALQPKVIIFDEPAAGLDPRGKRELFELIARLKEGRKLTIVYASSSLEDVVELADSIHILQHGRLAFSGTPREILARVHELAELDIALPEAAQIALTLREIFPTLRTDVLNLAELEEEIEKANGGMQFIAPTSRQAASEVGGMNRTPGEKTHD